MIRGIKSKEETQGNEPTTVDRTFRNRAPKFMAWRTRNVQPRQSSRRPEVSRHEVIQDSSMANYLCVLSQQGDLGHFIDTE